ncbi:MAG: organic hydroperoxide resistance protein [Thermonemataceae bacterium]
MIKITPMYTAKAVGTGGRKGHVKTEDNLIDTDVSMPSAMGGNGGKPNPELFFAAGYAACFGGALGAVAGDKDITDAEVNSHVSIGKDEDGGFGLAVKLHVVIPKLNQADAEELVAKAHEVCPYSRATKGNIEVEVTAEGGA